MNDVVELTRELVRRSSVSGNEAECVALLADLLPNAQVSGRNVWAVKGEGDKTLLLNSHTDTVPDSPEWTRDPWDGAREGGKVRGLGSNDAKGPLAALVIAFLTTEVNGRLVLAATCDEEIGGQGLGVLRPELPPIDAAIIGEPTGCSVCSGQRGLLRLRLHADGKRAHASRPHQGENAIFKAAAAMERLRIMDLGAPHPLLGPATVQITMIEGGVAKNVVPPSCTMELDARTHPGLDNETLRARIEELLEIRVELVSERFHPCATDGAESIVRAAVAASGTQPQPFGGVSDLFWVRDVPGIVMGPGRSEQSHAADEWVEIEQLERGVEVYRETIRRYFRE
ncbi:MAG: M20 family metallopeptidase [Planctomycetota bacterium]|jgi:acetylornithine deacetylase